MNTSKVSTKNSADYDKLVKLARKLFPGQVQIGTETYSCKCCGTIHKDKIIILKHIEIND